MTTDIVSWGFHCFGNFWVFWGPHLETFFPTGRCGQTICRSRWHPSPGLGMTHAADSFAQGVLGGLGPVPAKRTTFLEPTWRKTGHFCRKALARGNVNHKEPLRGNHYNLRGNHCNLTFLNHRPHPALHEEDSNIFSLCESMCFKCIRFECATLKYPFSLKSKSSWEFGLLCRFLALCDAGAVSAFAFGRVLCTKGSAPGWGRAQLPAFFGRALQTEGSRLGGGVPAISSGKRATCGPRGRGGKGSGTRAPNLCAFSSMNPLLAAAAEDQTQSPGRE